MRGKAGQSDYTNKPKKPSTMDEDSIAVLSIADVLHSIFRHKWFILICVLLSTSISILYIAITPPVYQATASLRIDPTRASSLGLNDLAPGSESVNNEERIATEIAIIQSDIVALETLNSLSDEDFHSYTGASRKELAIPRDSSTFTPAQTRLLASFKGSLSAMPVKGTQLVSVSFRHTKPHLAAVIVNHVMNAYLRQTFDSRVGSVTQVSEWLQSNMDTLQNRSAEAQSTLADFQERNNILGTTASSVGASNNTTTDRLGLLNQRLIQAQADRIMKEAQMRAAMTGKPDVLASLYPSADLAALQAEQGRLYGQYAQLSTKFGANYPPLIQLKSEMQKIDEEVDHEVVAVRNRLKQEYESTSAAENMLQKEYDDQTEKAYALNRKEAKYEELKAEVNASRELYNTLQYKIQQARIDAGLNSVNTILLDTARDPLRPVEPRKGVILSFGFILGIFAGVGLAFLKEATSDKVQGIDQVEHVLGYPLLATVPHIPHTPVPGNKGDPAPVITGPSPQLVSYLNPQSRSAESYRTLRNSILLSTIDHPPKTILITSSIPGEGKSCTASNLAVVLAAKGSRVLLLDADLRRPTQQLQFGIQDNLVGLSNVILGEVDIEPYRYPLPEHPNLSLLTSGRKVALPSELLGSEKFYSLLEKWESQFDFIVIDSAPLMSVSDTLPLASWADSLMLVTRYNFTPLAALRRIRSVLSRSNANVTGIIINDLVAGIDSYYGYGGYDYGYYK